MSNNNDITYKMKLHGFIEGWAYPISGNDWNKLKKVIDNMIPEKKIFTILATVSFSFFASAFFYLLDKGLPLKDFLSEGLGWFNKSEINVFIGVSILISTFIVGIVFTFVITQQQNFSTSSKKALMEIMDGIEINYKEPVNPPYEWKNKEKQCFLVKPWCRKTSKKNP